MKMILKENNNVFECDCKTIIEYDSTDLTLEEIEIDNIRHYDIVVTCPICGKKHRVVPVDYDSNVLISSIVTRNTLRQLNVQELSIVANRDYARNLFNIHDTRTITLKNGYNAVFEIVGINHDVRIDGKLAGLTFSLVDLYGSDKDGGRIMNIRSTNEGGYAASEMNRWLNEDFYSLLPDEWQQIIVPVVKKTADGAGSGAKLVDTVCKIFIPSEVEVFGQNAYSMAGEGQQYEGFKNWKNRIKGYSDSDYARSYWLRSPSSGSSNYFCLVTTSGTAHYNNAYYSYGVAPCFAI